MAYVGFFYLFPSINLNWFWFWCVTSFWILQIWVSLFVVGLQILNFDSVSHSLTSSLYAFLWLCHHFIANFKQRLAFPFYFWIVIIFSSIVISLLWISTFSFLLGEAITVTRFCNFAFLRQKKLETNVYDFLQAELLNQFQRLGKSLFFFRFLFPFVFLFYVSISIHYH